MLMHFGILGRNFDTWLMSARFLSCMSLHTAVPGILITGRQGMGKTSVAKEIARRLEADERVYACEYGYPYLWISRVFQRLINSFHSRPLH